MINTITLLLGRDDFFPLSWWVTVAVEDQGILQPPVQPSPFFNILKPWGMLQRGLQAPQILKRAILISR